MHANNEVGTLQPLAAIGAAVRARGIVMHTDAAQSAGKIPLDVEALQVDLLTLAGHKLYAPKGIGALYMREGMALDALVHGAGHEGGRRAGTESVLLAAGLGAACRLARLDPCGERLRRLRDRLWTRLQQAFGDAVVLNGHASERLPNTLNAGFVDRMGADLLTAAPAIAASLGAACHGSSRVLSPVLAAMGVDERVGLGAIRFSVGRPTTEREVDRAVDMLRAAAGLAG
jgi:cysteine desulfurase